jgi:26S proteasome regulatory subunit T5
MSTLEDLDDLEREEKEEKRDEKKDNSGDGKDGKQDGDAEMKDAEPEEDVLDEEILNSSTRDIVARKRLLENDMRIMKSEFQRLTHEKATMNEKIKDNQDKIENNR